MTKKTDFSEEEWAAVTEGPALAGMLVVTADRGGTLRETFALAKAYGDARSQHGASELLDEIVSEGPRGLRSGSVEELRARCLSQLGLAASALRGRATPEELADYRAFVLDVAQRVATAHKEGGESISQGEQQALDDVAASIGE